MLKCLVIYVNTAETRIWCEKCILTLARYQRLRIHIMYVGLLGNDLLMWTWGMWCVSSWPPGDKLNALHHMIPQKMVFISGYVIHFNQAMNIHTL